MASLINVAGPKVVPYCHNGTIWHPRSPPPDHLCGTSGKSLSFAPRFTSTLMVLPMLCCTTVATPAIPPKLSAVIEPNKSSWSPFTIPASAACKCVCGSVR